jgi:glycosyltransferase involved in cell wall biosynthesis
MLISIYMPTKDRLELLQPAVASVLAQTHREIELIVVNDGSSDGTRYWLDALARSDPRVQVIHHDSPRGAPTARNAAIRLARGDWVTGLDDDDEFVPERLERFAAEAARLDAEGVRYSGLYSLEHIVSPARRYTLAKRAEVELEDLFRFNSIGNQLFARRSSFLAVGGFDEGMPAWQDLDLFMRLVDRFGPARLVAEPLYLLADDDRSDRISKKKKGKMLDAYERVLSKWPGQPAGLKQRLYLQLLAPFYGFPFEVSDLRRFFGMGFSMEASAALLKLLVRRRRMA